MSHDRLMVISVAGFVVNLIGLFAFQHGGMYMVYLELVCPQTLSYVVCMWKGLEIGVCYVLVECYVW